MANELNPLEEEEPGSLNPTKEDEEEIEEDLFEEDISEEEKSKIALETLNKITGKNYKSLDDYQKSEKERDKAFSQRKPQKEVPSPKTTTSIDPDIQEALLFATHPELREAPEALKELREAADLKGKSVFAVYKESTYLQNRAKEESSIPAGNPDAARVMAPSAAVPQKKSDIKPTEEDIRVANRYFGGNVERYLKVKKNDSGVNKK